MTWYLINRLRAPTALNGFLDGGVYRNAPTTIAGEKRGTWNKRYSDFLTGQRDSFSRFGVVPRKRIGTRLSNDEIPFQSVSTLSLSLILVLGAAPRRRTTSAPGKRLWESEQWPQPGESPLPDERPERELVRLSSWKSSRSGARGGAKPIRDCGWSGLLGPQRTPSPSSGLSSQVPVYLSREASFPTTNAGPTIPDLSRQRLSCCENCNKALRTVSDRRRDTRFNESADTDDVGSLTTGAAMSSIAVSLHTGFETALSKIVLKSWEYQRGLYDYTQWKFFLDEDNVVWFKYEYFN